MKILISDNKICGLATDAYSGPMQWLPAPENFDEPQLDQYVIQDGEVVFPAAEIARAERNARLAASDWTQVADAPVDKQAWVDYRQALREVPQQEGFPWSVEWPEQP
jgi:hypothetical protein